MNSQEVLIFLARIIIVVAIATGTVYVGSIFSVHPSQDNYRNNNNHRNDEVQEETPYEEMTMLQAIGFPIFASISLVVLFFFFNYVQYFLFFMLVGGATIALYQLFHVFYYRVLLAYCSHYLASIHHPRMVHYVNLILNIIVLAEWIRSGNIICLDLLCCALCIFFIHTLRFPSFKIAMTCLWLLVIYDAFWVFYSEFIFNKNVMVEVATKQTTNPVQSIAHYLHNTYLESHVTKTIELPLKMIFPLFGRYMMLGLGDIALPGAFVALVLRNEKQLIQQHYLHQQEHHSYELVSNKEDDDDDEEQKRQNQQPKEEKIEERKHYDSINNSDDIEQGIRMKTTSTTLPIEAEEEVELQHEIASNIGMLSSQLNSRYLNETQISSSSTVTPSYHLFSTAIGGYAVGLTAAYLGNYLSGHAQPALIYLVPAICLPLLLQSYRIGKFTILWEGLSSSSSSSTRRNQQQSAERATEKNNGNLSPLRVTILSSGISSSTGIIKQEEIEAAA
jgi:hypothetical protein